MQHMFMRSSQKESASVCPVVRFLSGVRRHISFLTVIIVL